jgi:hypothetical protein
VHVGRGTQIIGPVSPGLANPFDGIVGVSLSAVALNSRMRCWGGQSRGPDSGKRVQLHRIRRR